MIEIETVGEHPKLTHNGVRFAEEIIRVQFVGTELVRCKDCKYCIAHEKMLFCGYWGGIGEWRFRTETDFCSRGERKDEGNNG